MLFNPILGRFRSVPAGTTPVVRTAVMDELGGTTGTTPAATQIGDLLIAARMSTGGGAPGLSAPDFTYIGDSLGYSQAYDVHVSYRIATAAGAQNHAMGNGGIGTQWWVIEAGTFNPSAPVSDFEAVGANHLQIVWNDRTCAANSIKLGNHWQLNNLIMGLPAGATQALQRNTSPYMRMVYKAGGWGAGGVSHLVTGTNGWVMSVWSLTVAGT